jgi:predicted kinase
MFFMQMSGFPGAGKSTLAKEIARLTGAVIVDHDVVKSALLHSIEHGSLEPRLAGKISYNIDWSLIDFHLSQGHSVIFDSPCLYEEMIEKGTRLSEKYGVDYKYVECYLNDFELINSRLKSRERMISQIPEAKEENFHYTINNSIKPDNIECLIVDTSLPLDHYLTDVMNYIDQKENRACKV